jgi:proteic killer suppression protein
MIATFGDKATEDIFNGISSRASLRLPRQSWARIRAKLDSVNESRSIRDLQNPPSNHLEKLKGDLAGSWSIRVNEQYRVVFKFAEGNCYEVRCTDYH